MKKYTDSKIPIFTIKYNMLKQLMISIKCHLFRLFEMLSFGDFLFFLFLKIAENRDNIKKMLI